MNETILDALVGTNQIKTQIRLGWQSVNSLPKLSNENRLYKIVVLKHKLLDIFIYSTVTIEYMYKIIALRSDFCTSNVVIFESSQTTSGGYAGP